jgi:hypothetical protein
VGRVSIRFAKDSWSYRKTAASTAPVKIAVSLPGGRREVWIKPHRRFWLYWWKVLRKEAELASTLTLKRKRGRWYAIFVIDVKPREEPPAEVVAFDINENSVAVARVSLLSTVELVSVGVGKLDIIRITVEAAEEVNRLTFSEPKIEWFLPYAEVQKRLEECEKR